MSKRNLLLGTAAGKVGDLVFYRAGGEQRTRAKVTPNNPKTYAQQAQRSRLANVTLTYRALSALCKDTFTNRKPNQTPFNAFSADALPVAPYLPKSNADNGEFVLSHVMVSKGSVPVPWTEHRATSQGGEITLPYAAAENPTTIGQLAADLIAYRPCCFAQGGTLVLALLYNNDDVNPGKHIARYVKIPIDTANNTALSTLGITVTTQQATEQLIANTKILLPTSAVFFGFAAVIEKPKSGGGYDVCDSRLTLNSDAEDSYDEFLTDEAAITAAESYGGTQGACVINS